MRDIIRRWRLWFAALVARLVPALGLRLAGLPQMAGGAILAARDAAVYWGSTVSPSRIAETRNISIDMSSDFIDGTAHTDKNRVFAPTFTKFNATMTGLYDNAVWTVFTDALSQVNGYFYIYPKSSVNTQYFYGRGYVSVDTAAFPYDNFGELNWSIKPSNQVTAVGP